MRDAGRHVAILSRGYKSALGALGDEQRMLAAALDAPARAAVVIACDPSRARAAQRVMRDHPDIDVFILDDAFQHRAMQRDFDLVLVNAVEPFGFGRVLPRGLLREPLRGLRRATAIALTHVDRVSEDHRRAIEQRIRLVHPDVPIYQTFHASIGFRTAGRSSALPPDRSVESMGGMRAFAFCGIAHPLSFRKQLERCGAIIVGQRWFADHHAYAPDELSNLQREASRAGAEAMVTTEKDWAKLREMPSVLDATPPILRLDVAIQFMNDDEERLRRQIFASA
jgi:tetraacyldisaccharide 4'-kinase